MIITLHLPDGRALPGTLPYPGAKHVLVATSCPACGNHEIPAQGGETTHTHDTYEAPARALCCGAAIGKLRVKVSTIFGIAEDEAVLNGRCRVY